METNRTKMVSLRIPKNLLDCVDRYVSRYDYLTRSRVIENCINAVMLCGTDDTRMKVVHSFDPYDDGLVITCSKKV